MNQEQRISVGNVEAIWDILEMIHKALEHTTKLKISQVDLLVNRAKHVLANPNIWKKLPDTLTDIHGSEISKSTLQRNLTTLLKDL